MRNALRLAGGFLVVSALALATGPAHAQTVSNGPYYATPAWDQTLTCTTMATCPRVIVLSNFASAAVLDRETGLVWEQSPATTPSTWDGARASCTRDRTTGGRRGWRLPSVHELASLLDPNNPGGNPDLPPGHPFTNVQDFYLSATTDAGNPANAWVVGFTGSNVTTSGKSGGGDFVWCARGGMNADQY